MKNKPSKIHPWPLAIFIGLSIVVCVNAYVIWIAHQKPPQLVSDTYYEDALHYDEKTSPKK